MVKDFWQRLELAYRHSKQPGFYSFIQSVSFPVPPDDNTLLCRLENKYLPDAKENGNPLYCPVCKTRMKDRSSSGSGYDSDNEWTIWEETRFVCHACGTEKVNDKWLIPEKHKASQKQIQAAAFISKTLDTPTPPPVKRLLWEFINKHLQQAVTVKRQNAEAGMENPFEDDFDSCPPYEDLC